MKDDVKRTIFNALIRSRFKSVARSMPEMLRFRPELFLCAHF